MARQHVAERRGLSEVDGPRRSGPVGQRHLARLWQFLHCPPRRLRSNTESMPPTSGFPVSVLPEAVPSSPSWRRHRGPVDIRDRQRLGAAAAGIVGQHDSARLAIEAVSLPLLFVALLIAATTSPRVAAPVRSTLRLVAETSVN